MVPDDVARPVRAGGSAICIKTRNFVQSVKPRRRSVVAYVIKLASPSVLLLCECRLATPPLKEGASHWDLADR